MELVKKTDDYIIYQKRSKRYAVRDANRKWITADDKVVILVKEKLLKVPLPKPKPKEEPKAEAAPEEASDAGAAESGESESGASESGASEDENSSSE